MTPASWLAALWIGVASAGLTGSAMAERLLIAAETTFAPFVMLDDAGELTGFDRVFGDEMCARAGLTCDWVLTEFDQLIPGVVAGRFDLAMSGLGDSPERRALVDFTAIYLPSSVPSAYVGPLGAPPPDAALIGVQAGTIHEAHVASRALRYQSFDTAQAALAAMAAGRVNLVFGSSSYFEQILPRTYPMFQFLSFDPVAVDGTAIAIAKGRDDLRNQLDATIAAMLADGTVAQMARFWFTARNNL
ncbi:transporter substrate-binding domain-containing protein [Flavimaricola marinus]|uniref:ABC transporter arginine-binding protein n=1 Tax=Flavimaricola marinus TaxID=1819565 RepID=A0A238LIQ4_9RHOB|nr:transporter substrate-binding domain-containing protein [Flavimaricola marinus]SMY09502.1 ABC transporter arginine-binding protein precursor [Flavimaricola marinus]